MPAVKGFQWKILSTGELLPLQIADNTIGLNLFDPKTEKNKRYRFNSGNPYTLMPGALNAAMEDRDGRLWLVNSGGTVQTWDRDAVQFKLYRHDPLTPASLASNDPIPIFEDRRGAIWIGTFGAGLDRYNPATDDFTHFSHKPGDPSTLPHNYPNGFFEDSKGNFYISTYGGLVLWDPLAGKVKQQLTKDTIWYTIHEDPNDDNLLWMAGYLQQGFCRFNKTTYDYHCYKHSNADSASPSSDSSIRFIFDAHDGNTAWIATWGGGLEKFDKRSGRFTHHRHSDGDTRTISSDQVYDVFQDSTHRLWVSTAVGIDRFDPETGVFQKLGATEGVPDNLVAHQVQEDDYGKLWIPTDAGLFRFDPEASRVMSIYTVEDGLHSTQFFDNSGIKTSDGRLWFGGFKGLTVVDPSALVSNPQKPVVYLTSVRVGGEEIKPIRAFEKLDQLKLDYRDPSFEFGFTGLSFTNARQNRFAYRLENWDERWQEVAPGEPRAGRFTNLPPGDYTLRIKAANNGGLWNEEGLRVAIHIPPPFWRTSPFYILGAALVLGVALAIYRLRVAQLRAANRRLEAKVEERSREARRRIVEITDNVPCVVFEFEKRRDGAARAPFASGGMEALIGVSAAEVMKDVSRYFATVLPEDAEAYVADIDRSAATPSDHRFTVRIRHAVSGEIRWLYVDAPAPCVDAEGTARWRGYIQDVTDQKRLEEARRRAEQELQRQAEELNTLANSIAQFAWMADAAGSIFWYNQRWYDYTGTTLEEMQGWGWQKVHHPEEIGRVVKSIQHAFATGEPWEDTFPLRSKDGEYRWFLSRALPIRDAQGRVVRWFGTNTDVTEQRQMEQAQQRQAEELKRINFLSDIALELTGCGYWHVDYSDPDHYYQSERAAKILGEPVKPDGRYHLQNEWFARLIEADPEVAKQTAERYQGAIEGRYQNYQATYAYKRPADGNVIWVHALGKVVRAENGHIRYMYGVYQDITQRIKDEATLRDAMEKLESATKAKSRQLEQSQRQAEELNRINILADSALDLASAGHWHFPLDNSGSYIPSERAARILGELPTPDHRYPLDQWAARVRAGDEAIAKATAENFAAAIAGTIPMYDATYLYKRPIDGRLVWIHALGHVVKDAEGKPTDMYGVIQDITAFKQQETDLRMALQKSDDATKAKSAFLANMSHEIRTPMNGIMGMTELALDTELTAEQRDYLVTVKSSADALLSLINDILDFSKIEAGRIELDPIEFLLRDSMGDTLSPLALRASAKDVELAYDIHPRVPDALIGDVYRLRQIIVNLAGNAIKFTDRGEVVITVTQKERNGDDVLLEVSVRDTGIGIAPEAASRLFKAFEQAEQSTTRKYGGTGLGLAISKQLVELMGGQIRLESTPGVGSTFIFTVKFKVGVARASATPEDAAKTLAGKVAIVVDDNETNRRIVGAMLGQWGLKVIAADSGKAALAMLDRASSGGQSVSFIITDLHMPGMDGFEFTTAVRAHPQFGSTTVMLLTSSASPGDQARCNELGVAARLLKPVKQSLLLDNVMRVLGAPDLAKAAAPARAPADAEPGDAVRPLKVLLAEDNAVNQKFAIRVLKGAGHSVAVANNGREAVQKTGSDSFDIVLMDVQMPEMDGLDATRAIRAREAAAGAGGSRLPIIAMTANAMKGDRDMCMDAGMDGYVAKPVKRELLFAEVARVLNGGSHAGN